MSESFAALFEESLQRSEMRAGEVITAEVVASSTTTSSSTPA
jgi:small subunit ribosomal protein S1